MVYVALLRGINVGGKNRVGMPRLKAVFEQLGFTNIKTYINSGNIIFSTDKHEVHQLAGVIEPAIEQEFGFYVPVVVRDAKNIRQLTQKIPEAWVNGNDMKTDVLFLWQDYDTPETLNNLSIKPELEDVVYLPGAIVWRVDRVNASKSGLLKIMGTPLYKHVTIRNINTLRKLASLIGQQ
jgi:uncharacterized protein (DUF1697 family)